jgi:endonuclease G
MTKLSFLIPFVCLFFVQGTSAATRNCTAGEKQTANYQLIAIQDSPNIRQDLLIKHLPFGIHTSNTLGGNEQLLYQNGYVMSHDPDLRTALWVSYKLDHDDITNASGKDRVICFRRDPRLDKEDSATPADYNEKIYDQGHMANDADLKDDLIEQVNTYVMSNMSPQHCRFNRGIWLSLEHLARLWADEGTYGNIQVTTGAIFNRDEIDGRDADSDAMRMVSRSNKHRVSVPSHYFKVILRQDADGWKSVSFLLKHDNVDDGVSWGDVKGDVIGSITTIEEIEDMSGYSLHPFLNRVELVQSSGGSGWDFTKGKSNFNGGIKNNNNCVTEVR